MAEPGRTRSFLAFAGRSMLVHTLTYLVFGLAARSLLDYDALWQLPLMAELYRPLDSPWVLAGPLLQPLRGLIFAVALWPLRDALLAMPRGWLVIWGLFVGFAILGTAAAAPGSVEGVVYTALPLEIHWKGSPEIYGQTLAYAWLLFQWERSSVLATAGGAQPEGPVLIGLKALCVVLAAFFGTVVAGVASAAAQGVPVEELSARPGATAALLAALAANLGVALVLVWRARAGEPVSALASLLLFYAACAVPLLLAGALAGSGGLVLGLVLQLLPATLAWGVARLLLRAPAAA